MGLPQGFCCWNLHYGSLAVGIICLGYAIMGVISGMFVVSFADTARVAVGSVTTVPDDNYVGDYEDDYGTRMHQFITPNHVNELLQVIRVISIVEIVMGCINIIVCSLLIHGIRTKTRGLMIPWMVLTTLVIAAFVIGLITLGALFGRTSVVVVTVLVLFLVPALLLYMLLVIISCFQRLGDVSRYGQMENQMEQVNGGVKIEA